VILPTTYRDQTLAIFGLGRTGITAALSLQKAGADVLAWDDNADTRAAALEAGVTLSDLNTADWRYIDALLLSPGVPHHLPEAHWSATAARDADTPIICDVEIFARDMAARTPRPKIIAITGTNGKSTTTTLIGHILTHAGRDAHIGGNIGRGVLDLPEPTDKARRETIYVLELSSYQLERSPSLHADAAILLNLSPDHLDRHGDMAAYTAAKLNIFANQTTPDAAIIGIDTPATRTIYSRLKARNGRSIIPVSTQSTVSHGINAVNGRISDTTSRKAVSVIDLTDVPTLTGRHNYQNAACAYAACRTVGLTPEQIARGMQTFPGLAHRMEIVGTAGPVTFINDSKATNAEAALQALRAFPDIHWIAGGMPKAGGIEPLRETFPNVTKAYLIGSAAQGFARTLDRVPHTLSGDLASAVRCAARDAFAHGKPTTVLLSPACASFDQFANFEVRGDAFRDAATAIIDMYKAEAKRRA